MTKDKIFESKVDVIKYKVMRELARQTWAGKDAFMAFNEIANVVVQKGEPPIRCCIYKDRAIIAERIRRTCGDQPVQGLPGALLQGGLPQRRHRHRHQRLCAYR